MGEDSDGIRTNNSNDQDPLAGFGTKRLTPDRLPRPATGPLVSPWRLLFQIGDGSQTTVGIEVRDQVVIGRSDPVATYMPEVDLTPYGGQEGGVSRRHAAITSDHINRTLYVEDLESTNGTRINGFVLEPHKRYRLRDGDNLEFGRVHVTIRFKKSPMG